VFTERLADMIDDVDLFFSAKKEWKSIRVNTLKISTETLKDRLYKRYILKNIPWFKDGFFIKGEISKTLEHFLGYYHIQGASSLVPPLVLDPKPDDTVLDMCAAPGSKTTQIASMMYDKGFVIANDNNLKRLRALSHNIQKSGASNCVISGFDGRFIHKEGFKFRKILLDAPCTASGRIFKEKYDINAWNINRIKHISSIQKMLIRSACECLDNNGLLVYSTCSLEPEENEEVISYALQNFNIGIENIKLDNIKTRPGLISWKGRELNDLDKAVRLWPQDNGTEGFFICKLRKF
jgi:NOL1/NOP2/sun family putative RNA methylase